MKLNNRIIYQYAHNLTQFNMHDIKLPVRINFFLQKNISIILEAAQEIEAARMQIAQTFGELSADSTQFIIPPEKMAMAQQEINDLFNLAQELDIHVFKLDEFDNIDLTYDQMSAIMFMIEE